MGKKTGQNPAHFFAGFPADNSVAFFDSPRRELVALNFDRIPHTL